MKDADGLKQMLRRIDGRGYGAYKDLVGAYAFEGHTLFVDHVQGDPFAAPSRVRVRVSQDVAGFAADVYHTRSRCVGACDFLTRRFGAAIDRRAHKRRGSGKSGLIEITRPGQEVLERTSVLMNEAWVEARFVVGLPAQGRRVLGREAERLFFEDVPGLVAEALIFDRLDCKALYAHIEASEDQDALRDQLKQRGLVAFVADGAILPRHSGVDDRPMADAVPFEAPAPFRVTLTAPNGGSVTGMGLGEGVTLIVGGGYHGKSTLLNALSMGVYNHVPGDGREQTVTVGDAVKVRAEDGRRVQGVDIRPFVAQLPQGKQTDAFSTDDASGSTSQAANIIEALEVGASLLLMDEDTSATNFMIRDRRMQALVAKDREPITPFIDKVRQLYDDCGVSTVLVVGGSGDYFDVADHVVMMDAYKPFDVTAEARAVAARFETQRRAEGGSGFGRVSPRILKGKCFEGRLRIAVGDRHTVDLNRERLDLWGVEQVADIGQTRAIAEALVYAWQHYVDDRKTLCDVVDRVMADFDRAGLDVLGRYPVGHYARPRRFELAAAINRWRSLCVDTLAR